MVYQIRLQGHLDCQWTDWFGGLTLTLQDNGDTLLVGPVVDQAALHALLKKVRDLGMPLTLVQRVTPDRQEMTAVAAGRHANSTHISGGREMKTRTDQIAPQVYARIGGVLYLLIIVIGFCGQFFVRNKLEVSGDVTATANNITAFESLWRLQIAGDLVLLLCAVALSVLLYALLKPVNKNLALMGAIFALVSMPIEAVSKIFLFAALFLSRGSGALNGLEPLQLHALGNLAITLHDYGFAIDLIFFGVACLINGYLLFRSGYFPAALGVLIILAGLSYLTNSFTLILAPAYASTVFLVLLLALIGEASLALWLLVKGVNLAQWEQHTSELTNPR